jgi:hypothetical protein
LSLAAKVLAHHCFSYYDQNNPFYTGNGSPATRRWSS